MTDVARKTVYDAQSLLRRPSILFAEMWSDLLASRELAWRLFVRNLSAQYRQSLLGYVWLVVPPVANTALWVFLSEQRIVNVGHTDIPYPVYVLIGSVLWFGFTRSITEPITEITTAKPMLAKINFPREALIIAAGGIVLFEVLVRIVLLVPVFVLYGVQVTPMVILAPVGVVAILGLGFVFGVLLIPIGILYTDIQKGILVATQFWFFLTPVMYTADGGGALGKIVALNPVTPVLVTTREMMTTGDLSRPFSFGVVVAFSVVALLIGWLLYRLALPHLIERMSA